MLAAGAGDTVVSPAFTGLPMRTLRNRFATEYGDAPVLPPMLQSNAADDIFRAAAQRGDAAYFPMPAGESAALVHDLPSAADVVRLRGEDIEPMVTWGITPGQSVPIGEALPKLDECEASERDSLAEAFRFMAFEPGQSLRGTKIDVAFIGSCTNGRLSDLREAAQIVKGKHVAKHVKALVVPGSVGVAKAAEKEGLDEVFRAAGFEWRGAGCSMCLGMNPDKLEGDQVCASSSNRNFKGRQGSPTGRTLLMSPAMVAAAALAGEVMDVRELD